MDRKFIAKMRLEVVKKEQVRLKEEAKKLRAIIKEPAKRFGITK